MNRYFKEKKALTAKEHKKICCTSNIILKILHFKNNPEHEINNREKAQPLWKIVWQGLSKLKLY